MSTFETLKDLENAVKKQSRKKRTETAILGSIALTGFLASALIAPNAVQVLQHMIPDVRPISHKQSVRRAIGRLIKHGYIKKWQGKYRLTKEGEARLEKIVASAVLQNTYDSTKKKWDGKWRVVIFDIKESRRATRDELRSLLVQTGFTKLQESVWVYPFRCDEVVSLLKFRLTLGWDLVYMIVDAIEGGEKLRKHYHLK